MHRIRNGGAQKGSGLLRIRSCLNPLTTAQWPAVTYVYTLYRFESLVRGNNANNGSSLIWNPVRAGLVKDPKDYRFCGYAEAVAEGGQAVRGLRAIWAAYADGSLRSHVAIADALQMHRGLIFGKRASDAGISEMEHRQALKILEQQDAVLPKATVLRCRVRYFSDGAIFGSQEFVRSFVDAWQVEKGRRYPPKVNPFRGADWQDLACIQGLRKVYLVC